VTVTNVNPTVDLTKSVNPPTLAEPGGVFTYLLTIHNTSVEQVTISALTDSNALSSQCLALVGTSLAAGGLDLLHLYDDQDEAGTYNNTASVTVTDNEGSTASDTATATVTVTNVNPTVDLTKSCESADAG